MKRNWFFLIERLQITPAERTAVTAMIAIMVILYSIPASWFRPDPFGQEYYAPVLADFEERLRLREIEQEKTLARFYPQRETVIVDQHKVIDDQKTQHLKAVVASSPSSTRATSTDAVGMTAGVNMNSGESGTPPGNPGTKTAHPAFMDSADSPPHNHNLNNLNANAVPDTTVRNAGKQPVAGKININTAGVTELQQLPGIGPSIAARIVEFRLLNGPFQTIDEITGVRGIGEARLNSLRNRITVR